MRSALLQTCGAAPPEPADLCGQQRAALVALWLACGRKMTMTEIAGAVGLTRQGAVAMMDKLSAIMPIAQDDAGRWRWVEEDD